MISDDAKKIIESSVNNENGVRDYSSRNMDNLDLQNIVFNDTSLVYSSLKNCNLRFSRMKNANGYRANFSNSDLAYSTLIGAKFSCADFSKSSLRGSNLSDARMDRSNLYETDLRDANLYKANLSRADMTRTNLIGANIRFAKLPKRFVKICQIYNGDEAIYNVTDNIFQLGSYHGKLENFPISETDPHCRELQSMVKFLQDIRDTEIP